MHMKINEKKFSKNQDGFVSIIVTLILMIILTLIVLGFAQQARREQRNALDRQLSTQAFYAAESGVNDFMAAINSKAIDIGTTPSRTDCNSPLPAGITTNVLDSSADIEFSCVLYSLPPTIEFGPGAITTNHVTIVPINNTDLTSISISWDHSGSDSTFVPAASFGKFTPFSTWPSDSGVLRVMLIPRDQINRGAYIGDTYTGFLYPLNGGLGTGNFASGANGFNASGEIVSANCNAGNSPHKCNASINGLLNNSSGYYLVLRSIYKDSEVSITCNNGANVTCEGSQIKIDVTGKANDVLRRIEKRIPITAGDSNFLPIGFDSVDSICKQIVLTPGSPNQVDDPGGCSF